MLNITGIRHSESIQPRLQRVLTGENTQRRADGGAAGTRSIFALLHEVKRHILTAI